MTSLTNSDDVYSVGLCPLRCGEGELGIVGVSVGEQHDNVLYAFSVTASAREASLARKAEQAKYQVHDICGGDVLERCRNTTLKARCTSITYDGTTVRGTVYKCGKDVRCTSTTYSMHKIFI